jgi:hypothetical protein
MLLDLPPKEPPAWLPPRPAIIRPAEHSLLRPGGFGPVTRAERRTIIADLVRTKRLTPEQAPFAALLTAAVGWGNSVPAITISNTANNNSPTGGAAFTFTNQSIGTAASTRIIVVAISCPFANVAFAASSPITIGGVDATLLFSANLSGSRIGFGILAVPSGTTATIVVNFASSQARCGISIYRLDNVQSLVPFDTPVGTSSSATGFTVNAAAGGVVIAAGARSDNTTDRRCSFANATIAVDNTSYPVAMTAAGVWTGATSNYDANIATGSVSTITGLAALSIR